MPRMRTGTDNYLFWKADWFSVSERQTSDLMNEIDVLNGNRLLNTSTDDLCDYFEKKYRIEVPELLEDKITADQREIKVDVSQDSMRFILDRSRPVYLTGTAIDLIIPFRGDEQVFYIRPSSHSLNPPRGQVRNSELILTIQGIDLEADAVNIQKEHLLQQVRSNLAYLKQNANQFNSQIKAVSREQIGSIQFWKIYKF